MLTRDDLIKLIDKHKLSKHTDFILKHSKPAIYLSREYVPNEDDISVGASKIGGNPDLPADFNWQHFEGVPLTFLAQIKLEDVKPLDIDDVLPDSGWLYFFYELGNQPYGGPDQKNGWQVIYIESTVALNRTAHPTANTEFYPIKALPAFKLSVSEVWTAPSEEYAFKQIGSNKPHWDDPDANHYIDLLAEIEDSTSESFHYLLGNPMQIQGDINIEASFGANSLELGSDNYETAMTNLKDDITQWRLLFQMDSDYQEDANFDLMFGDVGRVYFMIRESDLKARRFNQVWTIMQCT